MLTHNMLDAKACRTLLTESLRAATTLDTESAYAVLTQPQIIEVYVWFKHNYGADAVDMPPLRTRSLAIAVDYWTTLYRKCLEYLFWTK